MASTLDIYDRNYFYVSPSVRNVRVPVHNSSAFSMNSLIAINEHDGGNIKCPIVLGPSHLGKRFWCLYLSFDCQERRSTEYHS